MNCLFEFDKAGAEWVIVAYLSGDGNMLSVVEQGKSPHVVTGALMSGASEDFVKRENELVGHATDPDKIVSLRSQLSDEIQEEWWLPRTMSIRQGGKKSNHGLNYNCKYKTFALVNEIPENEAKEMIRLYREEAYPGIPIWQDSIMRELQKDRTLTNCFGRKRKFMDAWGPTLFDSAYAFKPQSTVFDITRVAMVGIERDRSPLMYPFNLDTQVHDSIVGEYPCDDVQQVAKMIHKVAYTYMNPKLHYNGRDFYVDTTLEIGLNWGQDSMHSVPLSKDIEELTHNVNKVVEVIKNEYETA